MKTFKPGRGPAAALLAAALAAATGCEEDCGSCGSPEPVVIAEEPSVPGHPCRVQVRVTDPAGFAVAEADVELIVAAVPETRIFGRTDALGRAWFDVTTAPGVTLIAYVSAPGYFSDAGDIGTYAGAQVLHIPVCLQPIP